MSTVDNLFEWELPMLLRVWNPACKYEMNVMTKIKQLIDAVDYEGLRKILAAQPALANQGIPFDDQNTAEAHPLHRICDGVFEGRYSD